MKKIAANYIRVSVDEDFRRNRDPEERQKHQKESIRSQRVNGKEFIQKKHPGCTYKEYEDINVSGTLHWSERPALRQLVTDMQAGKVEAVVVRHPDRLYRDTRKALELVDDHFLNKDRSLRVNLYGWLFPIDIATDDGRYVLTLQNVFDQRYVDMMKRLTSRSRQEKAWDGRLAQAPHTYGYSHVQGKRNQVAVVDEEAKIVRDVFQWYAVQQKPTRWILSELNARGIPTKFSSKEHLRRWDRTTILNMLRCVKYIGKMRYAGKVCDKSPFPPLVTVELWDAAQAELRRRSVNAPKPVKVTDRAHLLTGIIVCGACVQASVPNPNMRYCHSDRWNYYGCPRAREGGKEACPDATNIKADMVERYIEEHVAGLAVLMYGADPAKADADRREALEGDIEAATTKLASVQRRLDATTTRTAGVADNNAEYQLLAGMYSKLSAEREEIESYIQRKRDEIARLGNEGVAHAVKQASGWSQLDLLEKRRVLQRLVERVEVYPDCVVVRRRLRPQDFHLSVFAIPYCLTPGTVGRNGKRGRRIKVLMSMSDPEFVARMNECIAAHPEMRSEYVADVADLRRKLSENTPPTPPASPSQPTDTPRRKRRVARQSPASE